MPKELFAQYGSGTDGPFQTVKLEWRERPRPQRGQTVSGYGSRLPTDWQVKLNGRWRRVLCIQWANAGTFYVPFAGEKHGKLIINAH